MKRCPECRRDYYDDSLLYCLDDGTQLLEGPAVGNEPATAILHETAAPSEAATKAQIHLTEPQDAASSVPASAAKTFPKRLILGPLMLAVIILGGFYGYRYFKQARQIESIAVMPFVNESGNADVDYLSDGMTETLIRSLSQLPDLNVKARSSVFRYKGREADPKTVGNELNVQAVLIGRLVGGRGDQMHLNIELVDAHTEDVIWTDDYDRKANELVLLLDAITRDVSKKLRPAASTAEQRRTTKNYTENSEAYQAYLQGRFFWNKRTAEGIRTAIGHFERAVAADPDYALAYAGLADSYALLAMYGGGVPPTETMPKAKEYAKKALALDPELAEAHASMAQILDNYDYDFAGAEKEIRRALELNPSYPTAHQWLAEVLAHTGRFDESLAEIDKALELDPYSLIINRIKGLVLFYARRYDEALAQSNKTVALDQNFAGVYYDLFLTYHAKGDPGKALDAYARWRDLNGDPEGGQRARSSYSKGAWHGFMLDVANMRGDYRRAYPVRVAWFYLELGDRDAAIDQLTAAYDLRVNDLTWLKVDPNLDPLRGDTRFEQLLRKIGFPE